MMNKSPMYKKTKKSRRYPVLAALFFLFMIFALSFSILDKTRWDGEKRSNIVVEHIEINGAEEKIKLGIFSIEPSMRRAVYVSIPDNTLLEVPFGYNEYMASSVYRLGQLDKDRSGADLLERSVESTMAVATDGYLIFKGDILKILPENAGDIQEIKSSYFTLFGTVSLLSENFKHSFILETNLSLKHRYRLWKAIRHLREDQINFIDLDNSIALEDASLADGTSVQRFHKDLFDTVIENGFQDSVVRQEPFSVEVVNATDRIGLANNFSRILTNMGANVILRSTSKTEQRVSCLINLTNSRLESSNVVDRLSTYYNCKISENIADEEKQTDIKVILGEDFFL